MTDTLTKIKARLLTFDVDAWNHPRRAQLLSVLFLAFGGVVSLLLQTELAHRGYTVEPRGVFTVLIMLSVQIVGLVGLAVLD
ncbi:hypothetical protein C440_03463 [Haloferax mucosum ATCC BAA-1512]|uniref:Uncharacterized protein n=1 Tax=Haloferax mucosum ATCC BAA-1512 TaxID=662479 RepID=M0IJ61_9EURY|nr:hypothetical protein [Haloferax mucosum]ELZ96800.1 hypothetical protein C440_03463 [Haloferax mucosum ATCC BAA-1512]